MRNLADKIALVIGCVAVAASASGAVDSSSRFRPRPKILLSAGGEEHEDAKFKKYQQDALPWGVSVAVLGIPIRYAVLLVGAIEAAVALYCLFGSQTGFQVTWLSWLAANYVLTRVLLLIVRVHPQATCIGSLTDPLDLTHGMPGLIMTGALLYFLLGSCVASVNLLWLEDQIPAAETRKMSCPGCGIHIRFALLNLGQRIPCPNCRKIITLREPDLLKMVCFYGSSGKFVLFIGWTDMLVEHG